MTMWDTTRQKSHVPDFFVRLSNGDGLVVDVRRPDRVDDAAAQFSYRVGSFAVLPEGLHGGQGVRALPQGRNCCSRLLLL